MRTIKFLELLGLAIVSLLGVSSVAAAEPALRVLFLGNSTFRANGGSLVPFEKFCESADVKAEAVSQEGRIDPIAFGTGFAPGFCEGLTGVRLAGAGGHGGRYAAEDHRQGHCRAEVF